MTTKTWRLDRFIAKFTEFNQSDTRYLIAQKRIQIDGMYAVSISQKITQFAHVIVDDRCLQNMQPVYIKMHKPKGVVCATKDDKHTTVIDLLDHPMKDALHIVGRLDFNTTGLVLLTNDGQWSKRITDPCSQKEKVYEVKVANPITKDYILAFSQGIYFSYEDITTKPAVLEIIAPNLARLTLVEGKYHQVKRMFGYFQNEVLELHRILIDDISIDDMKPSESREFIVV